MPLRVPGCPAQRCLAMGQTRAKLAWIRSCERHDVVASAGALPGSFCLQLAKWFSIQAAWVEGIADGIVGFLGADSADVVAIRERVLARLPPYMHPSELRLVAEFALNANGKIDRKALLQALSDTPTR